MKMRKWTDTPYYLRGAVIGWIVAVIIHAFFLPVYLNNMNLTNTSDIYYAAIVVLAWFGWIVVWYYGVFGQLLMGMVLFMVLYAVVGAIVGQIYHEIRAWRNAK